MIGGPPCHSRVKFTSTDPKRNTVIVATALWRPIYGMGLRTRPFLAIPSGQKPAYSHPPQIAEQMTATTAITLNRPVDGGWRAERAIRDTKAVRSNR